MEYILAEALHHDKVTLADGSEVYEVKEIEKNSHKYQVMEQLLEKPCCKFFMNLEKALKNRLDNEEKLIIVTDWTDPTELVGLRLVSKDKVMEDPNRCFIAFYTPWEEIEEGGIESIFGHEHSHYMLYQLGARIEECSKSVIFHTSTSITDRFMAFSEGFAEFLEIVGTDELGVDRSHVETQWDHGYNGSAWLCNRDKQLRYHGVKNNRFIYHTSLPEDMEHLNYKTLHIDHITSSCFMPEKVKTANQILASEGAIASIFYHIYKQKKSQNLYMDKAFYESFGLSIESVTPEFNSILKMYYIMTLIDLTSPNLMVDFIVKYGEVFSGEKESVYKCFVEMTHFTSISTEASQLFGDNYRIGRRGDIEGIKKHIARLNQLKEEWLQSALQSSDKLYETLGQEIWISTDEDILPVPWMPEKVVKHYININTATEIDFMALGGMTYESAKEIVGRRDSKGGFRNIAEFERM